MNPIQIIQLVQMILSAIPELLKLIEAIHGGKVPVEKADEIKQDMQDLACKVESYHKAA